MATWRFTPEMLGEYQENGYFIARGLLTSDEVQLLSKIARADRDLQSKSYGRADGEGGVVQLNVENELPDETIYSAIVRSKRIVDTMEHLLEGEVYHYHHKMIQKDPRTGGAWTWHQDYGYWYNNGCLFPYMASCLIAIDRANRANGCLQVIKGSHHMGRINHGPVGDQTGADLERVHAALERLELVYCEMEPGDAVMFHSNLLHRSDQNKSEFPRWAFIACYNAARNNPYKESRHPQYSYLEKWEDGQILEVGKKHWKRLGQGVGV